MLEAEARESIAALVDRLRPFVARRVAAADAADVMQDVFLRIHRGLASVRDTDRFGPWIYSVVRNAITDYYRTRARAVPADEALGEDVGDAVATAGAEEDGAAAAELLGCVTPFVARLPSPYREAVTLVDLQGVAHKEAALMLGVSVPGVKSRVQRGRRKLRGMFDECCRFELDARRRVVELECPSSKRPGCGCAK